MVSSAFTTRFNVNTTNQAVGGFTEFETLITMIVLFEKNALALTIALLAVCASCRAA